MEKMMPAGMVRTGSRICCCIGDQCVMYLIVGDLPYLTTEFLEDLDVHE